MYTSTLSKLVATWTFALISLTFASCSFERYEPAPLETGEALLDRLLLDRKLPENEDSGDRPEAFTLADATTRLRTHGPEMQEAIAAYRTAFARAEVEAPWPNPSTQLGPVYGTGDDLDSRKVVPNWSLTIPIVVSDRLEAQDDLDRARAQELWVAAMTRFRELHLLLRQRYQSWVLARARERLGHQLLESTEASVGIARELVRAGGATALDVSLFQLEHARVRARVLEAEMGTKERESDLAELLALDAIELSLREEHSRTLPTDVPPLERLRALIAEEHPELHRARARYESAERALRLEIEHQFPDWNLNPWIQAEPGSVLIQYGLNLGLTLSLFDRNQKAIAEAKGMRDARRAEYEVAAHGVLTTLERAHRSLALAVQRHRILHDEVLPAARNNLAIARASLQAGSAGALQVLDADRSLRQVELDLLDAHMDEWDAWSHLERAVGLPLDDDFLAPPLPEGLERTPATTYENAR